MRTSVRTGSSGDFFFRHSIAAVYCIPVPTKLAHSWGRQSSLAGFAGFVAGIPWLLPIVVFFDSVDAQLRGTK